MGSCLKTTKSEMIVEFDHYKPRRSQDTGGNCVLEKGLESPDKCPITFWMFLESPVNLHPVHFPDNLLASSRLAPPDWHRAKKISGPTPGLD